VFLQESYQRWGSVQYFKATLRLSKLLYLPYSPSFHYLKVLDYTGYRYLVTLFHAFLVPRQCFERSEIGMGGSSALPFICQVFAFDLLLVGASVDFLGLIPSSPKLM
jgi:hypothetical protein